MELNTIKTLLSEINADLIVCVLTALFALVAWIVKGLISTPLTESRETFNKYVEKRIEILAEIKVKLAFLMHFPTGRESRLLKDEMRQMLLRDGKMAYLNNDTLAAIIYISIHDHTDNRLLRKTYFEVNADLSQQIQKISEETQFYTIFHSSSPVKRFTSILLLTIINISVLVLITWILILITVFIGTNQLGMLGIMLVIVLIVSYLGYKYM